jgi:DNA polymerase elongation subunit (family B)
MAFITNKLDDYFKIFENPHQENLSEEYCSDNEIELVQDKIVNDEEIEIDELKEDLIFQILDIDYYHREESESEKFTIMLFGKTQDNKSVFVNVDNFNPYFYVEIDNAWKPNTINKIINDIKAKVYKKGVDKKKLQEGLISHKIVKKHLFKGFTNDELFSFIELKFDNYDAMTAYANVFSRNHELLYISRHRHISFNLYESTIHPFIRFLHTQNLDPLGWCKIEKSKFKEFDSEHRKGQTDINITCDYNDVIRHESNEILKFKILSYDIEVMSEDGKFPHNRDGDKIIQIGMTYNYLGDPECFKQVILCLGKTSKIKGSIVKCYDTEEELLLAMTSEIKKNDPDIITGYNINGFDWDYLKNRADKLKIYNKFSRFSRISNYVCKYIESVLESSALGKNNMKYYNTPGRINIDLMKVIMRDHKLNSYTLDNVASVFVRDDIISVENIDNNKIKLNVKSTEGVRKDDYIGIYYNDGASDNKICKKKQIKELTENTIIIEIEDGEKINISEYIENDINVFWCSAKDDVKAKDIFQMYEGGKPDDLALIAKYCLKDCTLCNRIMSKLNILPNNIGMGNVCCVPLTYLFVRGQSVKIFSLVARQCRLENYLIPTNKKKWVNKEEEIKDEKKFNSFVQNLIKNDGDNSDDEEDSWYEGATVLEPIRGIHYEPVSVGDYSSLYPSSMIEKNFSHNSIVLDPKYDNLDGYKYHTQSYNNKDGSITTCRYAEKLSGEKATIPRILMKLLSERKKYKNMRDDEPDEFKKAVFEGLQLAYKVTANSLYGQTGSSVSPISMKAIAACTTSRGKDMLLNAKYFVENHLKTIIDLIKDSVKTNNDIKYLEFMREYYEKIPDNKVVKKNTYGNKEEYFQWLKLKVYGIIKTYNLKPLCIYGDTDSVFFKLNLTDRITGEKDISKTALQTSIDISIHLLTTYNYTLDTPQTLNYEKTFQPMLLIQKKRYLANKYEYNNKDYSLKYMGISLTRRDSANIVKKILIGVIDQILNKFSSKGAVEHVDRSLLKIIKGEYDIENFILTKNIKDKECYKDYTRIAHVMLNERMKARNDPVQYGSNERIAFLYIENDKKNVLQSERIEHVDYVIENNIKIDYLFYILHQIQKPIEQILELIIDKPKIIFNKFIMIEENRRSGIEPIMKYFSNSSESNLGSNVSISDDNIIIEDKPKTPKKTKKNVIKKDIKIKIDDFFID